MYVYPSVARQRLSKIVIAARNTHATIEELWDVSFSMRSVSFNESRRLVLPRPSCLYHKLLTLRVVIYAHRPPQIPYIDTVCFIFTICSTYIGSVWTEFKFSLQYLACNSEIPNLTKIRLTLSKIKDVQYWCCEVCSQFFHPRGLACSLVDVSAYLIHQNESYNRLYSSLSLSGIFSCRLHILILCSAE
jgi:hypothetical protein